MKNEEIATASDAKLIDGYIWDNNDLFQIETEMNNRGINYEKLVEKIEDLMYQAELRTL